MGVTKWLKLSRKNDVALSAGLSSTTHPVEPALMRVLYMGISRPLYWHQSQTRLMFA
jgi:hypothetical protein